jgi:hypothetical protein
VLNEGNGESRKIKCENYLEENIQKGINNYTKIVPKFIMDNISFSLPNEHCMG